MSETIHAHEVTGDVASAGVDLEPQQRTDHEDEDTAPQGASTAAIEDAETDVQVPAALATELALSVSQLRDKFSGDTETEAGNLNAAALLRDAFKSNWFRAKKTLLTDLGGAKPTGPGESQSRKARAIMQGLHGLRARDMRLVFEETRQRMKEIEPAIMLIEHLKQERASIQEMVKDAESSLYDTDKPDYGPYNEADTALLDKRAELKKAKEEMLLKWGSAGSTTITSDIDSNPKGAFSVLTVRLFNEIFRASGAGGIGWAFEPGTVYDINVYGQDYMGNWPPFDVTKDGDTWTMETHQEVPLDEAHAAEFTQQQEQMSYLHVLRYIDGGEALDHRIPDAPSGRDREGDEWARYKDRLLSSRSGSEHVKVLQENIAAAEAKYVTFRARLLTAERVVVGQEVETKDPVLSRMMEPMEASRSIDERLAAATPGDAREVPASSRPKAATWISDGDGGYTKAASGEDPGPSLAPDQSQVKSSKAGAPQVAVGSVSGARNAAVPIGPDEGMIKGLTGVPAGAEGPVQESLDVGSLDHFDRGIVTMTASNRIYEQMETDVIAAREAYRMAVAARAEAAKRLAAADPGGSKVADLQAAVQECARLEQEAGLTLKSAMIDALFFANEVYMTQGAVEFAVLYKQGMGKDAREHVDLFGGEVTTKLDNPRELFLHSFIENVGDTLKELNHCDADTPGGAAIQSAAKYIDRMMESAKNVLGDGYADAVRQWPELRALEEISRAKAAIKANVDLKGTADLRMDDTNVTTRLLAWMRNGKSYEEFNGSLTNEQRLELNKLDGAKKLNLAEIQKNWDSRSIATLDAGHDATMESAMANSKLATLADVRGLVIDFGAEVPKMYHKWLDGEEVEFSQSASQKAAEKKSAAKPTKLDDEIGAAEKEWRKKRKAVR